MILVLVCLALALPVVLVRIIIMCLTVPACSGEAVHGRFAFATVQFPCKPIARCLVAVKSTRPLRCRALVLLEPPLDLVEGLLVYELGHSALYNARHISVRSDDCARQAP